MRYAVPGRSPLDIEGLHRAPRRAWFTQGADGGLAKRNGVLNARMELAADARPDRLAFMSEVPWVRPCASVTNEHQLRRFEAGGQRQTELDGAASTPNALMTMLGSTCTSISCLASAGVLRLVLGLVLSRACAPLISCDHAFEQQVGSISSAFRSSSPRSRSGHSLTGSLRPSTEARKSMLRRCSAALLRTSPSRRRRWIEVERRSSFSKGGCGRVGQWPGSLARRSFRRARRVLSRVVRVWRHRCD